MKLSPKLKLKDTLFQILQTSNMSQSTSNHTWQETYCQLTERTSLALTSVGHAVLLIILT